MLCLLLLAGCATTRDTITYGGEFSTHPTSKTITIQVIYGTEQETRERCARANRLPPGVQGSPGCIRSQGEGKPALVYVRKPDSWKDAGAICQLGHEVTHELGGDHD